MRYLVTGMVKPGKLDALLRSIENGTLGKGSVAGREFIRNMKQARLFENGEVQWVEVCYCQTPLMEEMPYWEEFFDLTDIRDAHARHKCKHETGEELWSCSDCQCTQLLEQKLKGRGENFYND